MITTNTDVVDIKYVHGEKSRMEITDKRVASITTG